MEIALFLTILSYTLSAAGYAAYLFLQKKILHKAGFALISAGMVFHTFVIAYVIVKTGRVPIHNLGETLCIAGWTIVGVFLVLQYKYNLRILGVYTAPLAAIVMIVSSQLPKEPAHAKALLNSFWVVSHVVIIFIGEAAFAMACGVGILYLLQERAIKSKQPGFFFRRLPSLELLDTMGYTCIVVGFTMLTVGLITGFVYAKTAWGIFFSGDPKEVWSGISWLVYAALIHERLVAGWRGRKAAIWSIIGFAVLLFTFFGVNFLLKGHHEQFTRF